MVRMVWRVDTWGKYQSATTRKRCRVDWTYGGAGTAGGNALFIFLGFWSWRAMSCESTLRSVIERQMDRSLLTASDMMQVSILESVYTVVVREVLICLWWCWALSAVPCWTDVFDSRYYHVVTTVLDGLLNHKIENLPLKPPLRGSIYVKLFSYMEGHLIDGLHKFWREKNQAFEYSIM